MANRHVSTETQDLEISNLNRAANQVNNDDMRRKILAERRQILEPQAPVQRAEDDPFAPVVLPIHPDLNPAWDEKRKVGIEYEPMGARRALVKAVDEGRSLNGSALESMIRQYRMSGLQPDVIAAKLHMTEIQVNNILTRLRQKAEARTSTEIRFLQTERIEAIINALWNMVTNGSVEHIELALKAIERLNKMYELESEKVKIELDYVTEGQAEVIFRSCQMAVAAVVEVYEKKLAQAGLPSMDPEIIEGTLADAMEDAAQLIQTAQDTPLVLERKGKEMVLTSSTATG